MRIIIHSIHIYSIRGARQVSSPHNAALLEGIPGCCTRSTVGYSGHQSILLFPPWLRIVQTLCPLTLRRPAQAPPTYLYEGQRPLPPPFGDIKLDTVKNRV